VSKPPAEPKPTLEQWIYVGRRELRDATLGDTYLTPDGENPSFANMRKSRAIGATYEIQAIRRADGLSIRGETRFVKVAEPGDPRLGEWEALDRAAYTAHELRKAEQRAKRESPEHFGELTLAQLRALFVKQPAPHAAALLAQVLRYLRVT
jgi:hypothetical protein